MNSEPGAESALDITTVGDVLVIRFRNHRVTEETAEQLDTLAQEGHRKLLLDFSNVGFLSSVALGKMLVIEKRLKDRNGRMKLFGVRSEMMELFLLTRLDRVFEIFLTRSEALRTFGIDDSLPDD